MFLIWGYRKDRTTLNAVFHDFNAKLSMLHLCIHPPKKTLKCMLYDLVQANLMNQNLGRYLPTEIRPTPFLGLTCLTQLNLAIPYTPPLGRPHRRQVVHTAIVHLDGLGLGRMCNRPRIGGTSETNVGLQQPNKRLMSIQQIIVIEHDWNSKPLVSRGQEYGCIWTCQYLTGNTMLKHCSAALDLGVLYFQTDSNFASEAPTDRDWTKNTTVHFHRAWTIFTNNQRKQANTNFNGFNAKNLLGNNK